MVLLNRPVFRLLNLFLRLLLDFLISLLDGLDAGVVMWYVHLAMCIEENTELIDLVHLAERSLPYYRKLQGRS